MTNQTSLLRGALVLTVLAGCSKDVGSEDPNPQWVPSVGQSGQEGSCAFEAVEKLAFDPAATFERALGQHETRLRWREGEDAQPATFEIEAHGEPRVALRCGGAAFLDVRVHMQVPEAGVDVLFDAVAQAWGAGDEVMFSTTLDGDWKSTLRAHADELATDWLVYRGVAANTRYYFDLWHYSGKISGQLVANRDREFCGMAVWPEQYCDTHRVALPADTTFEDFEVADGLEAMQAIGEQTLAWPDGTTTQVRFELERDAGSLCVGPYFARWPEKILDGIEIEAPARIRVVTTDGRLDAELPGKVMAVTSPGRGWREVVRLEAGALGLRPAVEAAGVRVPFESPEGSVIAVQVDAERALESARGSVGLSAWKPADGAPRPRGFEPNWQGKPLRCSSVQTRVDAHLQATFGGEPAK